MGWRNLRSIVSVLCQVVSVLVFCSFSECHIKVNEVTTSMNPFVRRAAAQILSAHTEDYELIEKIDFLNSSFCDTNDSSVANMTLCLSDENLYGPAPQFDPSTMARVITLSAIAGVSLVGNLATLFSILRTRRQTTSTVYLLIAHLAVADLLVSLFCVLAEAVWTFTVQWYAGNVMCKLVKYMQMFSLYLSTFILVVIGFDRMVAIRYPMRRVHAKHNVRKGILFVWCFSALLSIPQLIIFRVKRGPFVEEFYQCVTYGFYTANWQEQLYTTISLILMFLIPLIILIVTYVCTFRSIANSGRENIFCDRMGPSPLDEARRKIIHKAKAKSLAITVVIVLAFVVCWTPYYATMIIFIFLEPDDQLSQELQSAIFFFGSSSAMINPLIYGAFHLRKRRTRTSRRSTTLNNNSSATSSRIENSVMLATFRKSRTHPRPSREHSGPLLNPELSNGNTCNGAVNQEPRKENQNFDRVRSDFTTSRLLEDTL